MIRNYLIGNYLIGNYFLLVLFIFTVNSEVNWNCTPSGCKSNTVFAGEYIHSEFILTRENLINLTSISNNFRFNFLVNLEESIYNCEKQFNTEICIRNDLSFTNLSNKSIESCLIIIKRKTYNTSVKNFGPKNFGCFKIRMMSYFEYN